MKRIAALTYAMGFILWLIGIVAGNENMTGVAKFIWLIAVVITLIILGSKTTKELGYLVLAAGFLVSWFTGIIDVDAECDFWLIVIGILMIFFGWITSPITIQINKK